jgi:hypothetical protein
VGVTLGVTVGVDDGGAVAVAVALALDVAVNVGAGVGVRVGDWVTVDRGTTGVAVVVGTGVAVVVGVAAVESLSSPHAARSGNDVSSNRTARRRTVRTISIGSVTGYSNWARGRALYL